MHLWIPFNSWLTQVVYERKWIYSDRLIVQAACLDPKLIEIFDSLLSTDENFYRDAEFFQQLWPVFEARTLYEKDISRWGVWNTEQERSEYRDQCLSPENKLSKKNYAPSCFLTHQPKSNDILIYDPKNVPLDWRHTLAAIYKVRCNLFHGGKRFEFSKDQNFVRLAYKILSKVWANEYK